MVLRNLSIQYGSSEPDHALWFNKLVLAEWFPGTCQFNMVHQNLTMHYGLTELILAEWFSRTCPFKMVHQNLTIYYGLTELVLAEWFSRTCPFNIV
jgi:uncharacterized cysteine cluster protein YcgN (CxxCxxCC family)